MISPFWALSTHRRNHAVIIAESRGCDCHSLSRWVKFTHMNFRKLRGMLRLFRPDLSVASGVCVLTGQLLALGRLPSVRAMGLGFLSIFMQALAQAGRKPQRTTYVLVSNYEEVGHGASAGIPAEVEELIAVDMAAVGEGQTSDEFHSTLCVKDSGGPYHHGLSQKLRRLAEEAGIAYKVDIYPYYGSDGEACWRAGGDVAVALIGPGVDASHNYERTHTDALRATTQWILAYLLN